MDKTPSNTSSLPKIRIEDRVHLDKLVMRPYQKELWSAWRSGKKKMLAVWARRSGKDVLGWNMAIRQCIEEVCTVYYMLPTLQQARKVIWNAILKDGSKFIDFIPSSLIASKHEQDMRIHFTNGSVLQLCGSNSFDHLVGVAAKGIVMSEFALTQEAAYHYMVPVLQETQGWLLCITTPRGKNFAWHVYNIAKESPEWFVSHKTVEDTGHISLAEIQKIQMEGIMTKEKILSEFYCDFNLGIEGTIFGRFIERAINENRVTYVPVEAGYPVHVSFDIGRDTTSMCFLQIIGGAIRFVDYYEKANENLEHFVRIMEQKNYRYGKACFPHDMAVTEWSGAKIRRLEKAKMYGLDAFIVPNIPLEDGIEHAREYFAKCWFDAKKCDRLIAALENYQREYNEEKKVYSAKPLHNWASHPCDSFRYALLAIPKLTVTADAKALDERYRKTVLGSDADLPPFFR